MKRAALISIVVVACGGSTSPASNAPSSGDPPSTPAAKCDAPLADVEVIADDLNGYPPYAVTGCSLVYVSSSGSLVLRDLATGTDATIAPASEHPRRPAASNELIAWESLEGDRSIVRVLRRATRETATVDGAFVQAGEPRVAASTVVFTAWLDADDTDVWLYDASTGSAHLAIGGPAQQRFADVSDAYVVATDFSEDPDGKYDGAGDLADIVVLDRGTGAVTKRAAEKKQAFPMLVDGTRLSYLEWNLVHPEPKLEGYALRVGAIAGAYETDVTLADVVQMTPETVRPSTANGLVEWIANPDGVTRLYRAPADGSAAPEPVPGLDGLHLYAPASTAAFTVLAAVPADRTPREIAPSLRMVAR